MIGIFEIVAVDLQLPHMYFAKALRRMCTQGEPCSESMRQEVNRLLHSVLVPLMDAALRDLGEELPRRAAAHRLVVELMMLDCRARDLVEAHAVAHDDFHVVQLDVVDADGALPSRIMLSFIRGFCAEEQTHAERIFRCHEVSQRSGERCAGNERLPAFRLQHLIIDILPCAIAARADEERRSEDERAFEDDLALDAFFVHRHHSSPPFPAAAFLAKRKKLCQYA